MYRLVDFDGVTLPKANVESEVGTVGTRAALTSYRGGVFDADGTGRAVGEYPYQLPYRVELVGSSLATLRSELDALRAKRGVRGTLRREGVDAIGTYQWATARLLQVPEVRTARNVYFHPLTLQFLVLTPWYAATPVTVSSTVTASTVINFANAGMLPVTATTWEITAPVDAAMPEINIYRSDYATNISYNASVAATHVWTLDTASWQVTNNGVADSDNLHISGGQWLPDLIQIEPAGSTYTLAVVGGSASAAFTVTYYEMYE
jgi:hypothetical protein